MPTNTTITKLFPQGLLITVLLLSPTVAELRGGTSGGGVDSQVELEFVDFKSWRQTDEFSNFYEGGRTDVFFHDGFWVPSGCICHNPALFRPLDAVGCDIIIGPSPACPIGTTAFISRGDIDGNGRIDVGGFVSASEVVRSIRVEPFRIDQFKIIAAPPSGIAEILRSTNGDTTAVFDVVDSTVTLFFNVLAPPVDDYDITVYEGHRHYGPGRSELQRHFRDVPWGTYLFTAPELDSRAEPPRPVPFAVTHLVAPDAYPGRGAIAQGWRVINTNWFDGDQQLDPRLFFEFRWAGLDQTNVVPSDSLFFSMRGHQYAEAAPPGPIFTPPPTRAEIPPEALFESEVQGVSCIRFPPFPPTNYTVVGILGTFVTTGQDLTLQLARPSTYLMEITSGEYLGVTQTINYWGVPDNFTLQTEVDLSNPLMDMSMPTLLPGDTFTLTQTIDAVSIVTLAIDITDELDPTQVFQARILSGDLIAEVDHDGNPQPGPGLQYPIKVIGPQAPDTVSTPDLTPFEFVTHNDVSGGSVSGSVVGVAGTTLTTNRDLANCLTRPSYRLTITSGSLQGLQQFPIVAWGNPTVQDLTLTAALPGLLPGDRFELRPEDVISTSTVQTVAGFFVEGDRDLSSLLPGVMQTIVITSGALAGQTEEVLRYGFPSDFWFETKNNLSGRLLPGDTYRFTPVTDDVPRLRVGDLVEFTQLFPDWVQEKYDNGELHAVDAITLSSLPLFGAEGYNIAPTAELIVAPGLYGVARENVIVFPPFPIAAPAGDRSEFLLGTLDGFYEFGPFVFQPGDSVAARLHFTRNLPAGGDTFDVVDRLLNWEINLLDTYDGFALLGGFIARQGFPFGTPRSERLPNSDLDNDGVTNLLEFSLNTSVSDPNDRPQFQFVHDGALGSCTAMITKRPHVGPSLRYTFEYSGDLVNWTRILPGDPFFDIITNDETTLEVSNLNAVVAGAFPQPSCFIRLVVDVVNVTTQETL